MERYVDSDDRFALMRAWCGCMDMGAWRGLDEDAFISAVKAELKKAGADPDVEIEIEHIETDREEMRLAVLQEDQIDWQLYEVLGGRIAEACERKQRALEMMSW